ncbi:MAG TPA: class I SAM-dependent methyltransferase [Ignavibacteria bacterium]|nr:class I SAM-dependent methyltransferase [Ignavibacteria bacterium]
MKKEEPIEKIDFDEYADVYDKVMEEDLKFFGEENTYFAEYKVKIVQDLIKVNPDKILEYGCGIGRNIKFFKTYFPSSDIEGCDISQKSIDLAKKENPNINFYLINDEFINSNLNKYNLIFISCVFHHISPELRNDVIKNINKLLKPKGSLFIFEHNPYNPVTLKIVKDCIWDKDAILLKPKETKKLIRTGNLNEVNFNYTLFFPSQLKKLRFLEKYLKGIPLGGQYFIQAEKV